MGKRRRILPKEGDYEKLIANFVSKLVDEHSSDRRLNMQIYTDKDLIRLIGEGPVAEFRDNESSIDSTADKTLDLIESKYPEFQRQAQNDRVKVFSKGGRIRRFKSF